MWHLLASSSVRVRRHMCAKCLTVNLSTSHWAGGMDSSVVKKLAVWIFNTHVKVGWAQWRRSQGVPRASWPATLAGSESSRVSERACLNMQCGEWPRKTWHPSLVSTHTSEHAHKCIHTHTYLLASTPYTKNEHQSRQRFVSSRPAWTTERPHPRNNRKTTNQHQQLRWARTHAHTHTHTLTCTVLSHHPPVCSQVWHKWHWGESQALQEWGSLWFRVCTFLSRLGS